MLHFENSVCLRCGTRLGFLPDTLRLSACDPQPDDTIAVTAAPQGSAWVACGNAASAGCNWLVRADSGDSFCPACELNRTIPDLAVEGNEERWRKMEEAKRRLIYALKRLNLPLTSFQDDKERGLAFDFLADEPDAPVMTGHDDGLITINISEAIVAGALPASGTPASAGSVPHEPGVAVVAYGTSGPSGGASGANVHALEPVQSAMSSPGTRSTAHHQVAPRSDHGVVMRRASMGIGIAPEPGATSSTSAACTSVRPAASCTIASRLNDTSETLAPAPSASAWVTTSVSSLPCEAFGEPCAT